MSRRDAAAATWISSADKARSRYALTGAAPRDAAKAMALLEETHSRSSRVLGKTHPDTLHTAALLADAKAAAATEEVTEGVREVAVS